MGIIPAVVAVPTKRLVAILELAEWGARSEAERVMVEEIREELRRAAEAYMASFPPSRAEALIPSSRAESVNSVNNKGKHEVDHGGFASGAIGAQPTGAGDGDSGGQGAESGSARISMV